MINWINDNTKLAILALMCLGTAVGIAVWYSDPVIADVKKVAGGLVDWWKRFRSYKSGHGKHSWKGANLFELVPDAWMPA